MAQASLGHLDGVVLGEQFCIDIDRIFCEVIKPGGWQLDDLACAEVVALACGQTLQIAGSVTLVGVHVEHSRLCTERSFCSTIQL